MQPTAHEQRCGYVDCGSTSSDLKCCANCRKVRYCSAKCQTMDWERHIFDCKAGKPISTIYYLARDLGRYTCKVPLHHQTCIDYGFDKAQRSLGSEGATELASFYRMLIRDVGIPLTLLRKLQKEGRLVEGIKCIFETCPPEIREQEDGPYHWFLVHQYLFDGRTADPVTHARQMLTHTSTMILRAWPYAGGSPSDTLETILSKRAKFSANQFNCFFFVAVIFDQSVPDPDIWLRLTFGFVAEQALNVNLGLKYAELCTRCTFKELCEAYEGSSIPALFARYGIVDVGHHPLFRDIMSGSPSTFKSVWRLKFYIEDVGHSRPGEHALPAPSVVSDYGYGNCKSAEETKLLDELYAQLFGKHAVDPLALHAACREGRLLEFAKKYVKLSPWTAKYARLLRNAYPF
ncbi:hypothetical protein OH76DRAFT_1523277 [Lentinus brumalis]|uniref:MYND-type domain-containing protein n=1 Tax=Lentinus brumalis TaxID=2498619 RepID=A0A371D5D4_9APHY|nr:hypothetical protein OH76DRAFT_1523277 [Polyporus brumalis]